MWREGRNPAKRSGAYAAHLGRSTQRHGTATARPAGVASAAARVRQARAALRQRRGRSGPRSGARAEARSRSASRRRRQSRGSPATIGARELGVRDRAEPRVEAAVGREQRRVAPGPAPGRAKIWQVRATRGRPAERRQAASSRRGRATRSASGGRLTFQASACAAATRSRRGPRAPTSIGGGARERRPHARAVERRRSGPAPLTSSPRQSRRTRGERLVEPRDPLRRRRQREPEAAVRLLAADRDEQARASREDPLERGARLREARGVPVVDEPDRGHRDALGGGEQRGRHGEAVEHVALAEARDHARRRRPRRPRRSRAPRRDAPARAAPRRRAGAS